jgi:membrane-associated protease RseP (regulator of RpoE activity)
MKTKLFLIAFMSLLLTMTVTAQNKGFIGVIFEKSTSQNWGKDRLVVDAVRPHFPADRAGIKPYDIITQINGQPVDNLTSEQATNLIAGNAGTQVTLSVIQIGQAAARNITLTLEQGWPDNSFCEADLLPLLSPSLNVVANLNVQSNGVYCQCVTKGQIITNRDYIVTYYSILLKDKNDNILIDPTRPIALTGNFNNFVIDQINKNTIRDPDANFELYKSFDFEFSDVNNPIREKQLATVLQSYLEEKGLKRDKENPDLLVFITSYSGDEKQYVPPTQQVTTRYQFGYDIWSGFGNKQYVESQQQGGYTEVTYIASLKVAIMDAHKAQQKPKVPPIVWQSEFNTSSTSKVELLDLVQMPVFSWMIRHCYPVQDPGIKYESESSPKDPLPNGECGRLQLFFYTGICYSKDVPNKVVYVYPESPADKAGIQVGDIITAVNNRPMPTTKKELMGDFINKVKNKIDDKTGKIKISLLDDPKYKAGFTYLDNAYESPKTTYTFEVNRNGSTQTISITPEKRIYNWGSNNDGQGMYPTSK